MRTGVAGLFLATAVLVAAPASAVEGAGPTAADPGARPLPPVAEILASYSAGVDRALSDIESLFVRQIVIEPCDGDGDRTAVALLTYVRGNGLERIVQESSLRYPSGRYTLKSLVGPAITPEEYDVTVGGPEIVEGEPCLRLELEALVRDEDHFDGTVWLSMADWGLVRIVGEVADPPFPARMIRLDKSFERVEAGLRLVRRHTGEVEVGALLGGRRGVRHIFYEEYTVRVGKPE